MNAPRLRKPIKIQPLPSPHCAASPPYGDLPTGRSGSDLASASQTIHPKSSKRHTHCAGIFAATCLVVALRPYRRSEAVPELPRHALYMALVPGCERWCCRADLWGLRLVFIVWRTEKGPRFPSAGGGRYRSSAREADRSAWWEKMIKIRKSPTWRKRTQHNNNTFNYSHKYKTFVFLFNLNIFNTYEIRFRKRWLEVQIKQNK